MLFVIEVDHIPITNNLVRGEIRYEENEKSSFIDKYSIDVKC